MGTTKVHVRVDEKTQPNATTVKALRAAEKGKGKRSRSATALIKVLGIRTSRALGFAAGASATAATLSDFSLEFPSAERLLTRSRDPVAETAKLTRELRNG